MSTSLMTSRRFAPLFWCQFFSVSWHDRRGLASKGNGGPALFSALIMVFALLCWGAALMIPHTSEAAPALHIDRNIVRSTGTLLKELWSDARLRWSGGAVILSLLPPLDAFCKTSPIGDKTQKGAHELLPGTSARCTLEKYICLDWRIHIYFFVNYYMISMRRDHTTGIKRNPGSPSDAAYAATPTTSAATIIIHRVIAHDVKSRLARKS